MEDEPESAEDGFILIEGWMFGALYFADAMEEVLRVPPANDTEPPQTTATP